LTRGEEVLRSQHLTYGPWSLESVKGDVGSEATYRAPEAPPQWNMAMHSTGQAIGPLGTFGAT